MKSPEWAGKIFVGGGFLRSIVAGDEVNDIDVFCPDKSTAHELAVQLSDECLNGNGKIYTTDNAYTMLDYKPHIQIIHRWSFNTGLEAADSFDFTCCCAMFWWGQKELCGILPPAWQSYCDPRFYCDVAAKRLIYRSPVRNEDAGGSMLRVLKYYQKGYRIPLDSLADVITRLVQGVDSADREIASGRFSSVVCGLLREVDPAIDPNHVAHLPAENARLDLD